MAPRSRAGPFFGALAGFGRFVRLQQVEKGQKGEATNLRIPGLIIETSQGVDRVVIEFDRGDRERALALLERALPAIHSLDRAIREPSGPPPGPSRG